MIILHLLLSLLISIDLSPNGVCSFSFLCVNFKYVTKNFNPNLNQLKSQKFLIKNNILTLKYSTNILRYAKANNARKNAPLLH